MAYQTIVFEKKDRIGTLYLNRPEVLNALSDTMRQELLDVLADASADETLRVLILTGKGRAFSAGADLNMFKERYETYRAQGQGSGTDRVRLPKAFMKFPKPIIAAINGPAVGFGATLPLICDIRIASEQARISFAFAKLGVTPEFGSSYFLPRLIGYGKAAELVFTAKMMDAREALEIGVVNQVVPHDQLIGAAEEMAETIAQHPAEAVVAAKRLLRHGSHSTLEQVVDYEALIFQQATQTRAHYDAVLRTMEQLKRPRNK